MNRIVFVCTLWMAATTALTAQEVIQWRGEERSGVYRETGLLKAWPADGPQLAWHYDGLGEGHSSVAISSGKIYVTGMTGGKGFVYVLDDVLGR